AIVIDYCPDARLDTCQLYRCCATKRPAEGTDALQVQPLGKSTRIALVQQLDLVEGEYYITHPLYEWTLLQPRKEGSCVFSDCLVGVLDGGGNSVIPVNVAIGANRTFIEAGVVDAEHHIAIAGHGLGDKAAGKTRPAAAMVIDEYREALIALNYRRACKGAALQPFCNPEQLFGRRLKFRE